MPALKDPKFEIFAQLIAAGCTGVDAVLEVKPQSARWKRNTIKREAFRLRHKPEIDKRIAELLNKMARATIASRVECAEYATKIIREAIGNLDSSSPLVQEYEERETPEGKVVRIKMPAKLGAIEALAKMMGYNEPEKSETTVRFVPDSDVLESLDQALRASSGGCSAPGDSGSE